MIAKELGHTLNGCRIAVLVENGYAGGQPSLLNGADFLLA
jgi:hypothetical protein